MRALERLPAPDGIAAMQSINVTVLTPVFMATLFGIAAGCVGLPLGDPRLARLGESLAARRRGAVPGRTIGLTGAFHQPRNLALATVDPRALDAEPTRRRYASEWTALNHLRTLAALGCSAALSVAAAAG